MSGESSSNGSMSSIESELYFLISRFLGAGPCKKAAQALREEVEQNKLLPKRIDWEGREHQRSYENLVELNRHITSDHLLRICQRLGPLLDKEIKPHVTGVQSLLGAGRQSLLRTKECVTHPRWQPLTHVVTHHHQALLPPTNLVCPSLGHVLKAREMSGTAYTPHLCSNHTYSKVSMHGRKLGHLSAVYCITFDRTGQYVITGADDALLKIWYANSGRLLATLRGHASEITDIAVNYENTLLASGSCDKIIRVWCLKTKAPISVLHGHTGMITSLQFCPQSKGRHRILSSTGGDGCVCFWFWDVKTRKFDPKPAKFIERSRVGAQMLCSSFSPGGIFLATGNSDHVIRVYIVHGSVPEKICELESHSDRVDSICYSNSTDRFVSGSRDGTARIWRFDRQEWKAIVLNMATKLSPSVGETDDDKAKLRVTMVAWNLDDSFVITAISDCSLKVWDSHTGKLVQTLTGHEDEVFVLEHSPRDPRILLSAGHDGKVVIWDIIQGIKVKSFFNMIEGQGHGAVFDCKFSPDGLSFSATDSHGHLLLFGFGSNEKHKKIPQDVFFHTDYRPLIRDANNYVLDEQTQQPPHLMPPPFLVDIDGNPYPPSFQRLVPGREQLKNEYLIPQMAVNEEGDQEVVGDIENHEQEQAPAGQVAAEQRPSIDHMIQRLQREQDQRMATERGRPLASPPPVPGASPRASRSNSVGNVHHVGMRMSGEMEGVRQSLSNITQQATQSDIAAASRRVIIKGLDQAILSHNEELRAAFAEEESKKFIMERKKKPLPGLYAGTSDSGRHKGKKRGKHADISTPAENEETATNRLATRALYDTEEEEEEDNNDDQSNSSSDASDGDSSEYSDWMGDAGTNLQPPKRRSQRRPKRKQLSLSETELDDSDTEDLDIDDQDDTEDTSKESPGQQQPSSSRPRRQPQRKKPPPPPKKKRRIIRKKKQIQQRKQMAKKMDEEGNDELPPEFYPPEWLTGTIPRKAPYVPQMGDEVMYFRQGHGLYLQAVKKHDVYSINPNKGQPWHKNPHLREQELVKLVGIKYEIRPPRLCCLKLAHIDPETHKPTGESFSIKYHDMPDVIDFIVLKQNYDIAMKRKWKAGDRFRSMIDDAWWFGKIVSQQPFQEEYPDSMFQCFYVQWDNRENEKLSPWDMEPIENNTPPVDGGSVPVDPDELKTLMYTPQHGEWGNCGRDTECDRIVKGMEILMEHSIAEMFLTPVDLNSFPSYAIVIEYPIDLSTIKSRLENRFYRRINALQFDIRYLEINARKFNEPGTPITKNARILTECLLKFISESDAEDPMNILYSLLHGGGDPNDSSDTEDEDEEEQTSRKRKRSGDEGPRKRLKAEHTVDLDDWKRRCKQLITTMYQCEDSEPFRDAVDPDTYPEYYQVIDNPMDLGIVRSQFETNHYSDPIELSKDLRLIFQNSKSFNTNKRSRIYAMTLRLSAMFEEQMKDIILDWKTAVKRSRGMPKSLTNKLQPKINGHMSKSASSSSGPHTRVNGAASSSTGFTRSGRKINCPKMMDHDEDDEEDIDDDKYVPRPSKKQTLHSKRSTRSGAGTKSYKETHYDSDTVSEDNNDDIDVVSDEDKKTVKQKFTKRKSTQSKTNKGKKSLTNGHSKRHSTRVNTGVRNTKRVSNKSYYMDEDTEDEKESLQRRKSDSISATSLDESGSSSGSSSSSSSSSSGSSSGSDSSASSSGSNSDSENSDSEPNRTKTISKGKRPAIKPRLKATESFPVINKKQKNTSKNTQRSVRTRNQGRQTVKYEEDSDGEYEGKTRNRGKRTVRYHEDSDYEGNSGNDSDGVSGGTGVSMSSRGRIRKLTARARASLLGGKS